MIGATREMVIEETFQKLRDRLVDLPALTADDLEETLTETPVSQN